MESTPTGQLIRIEELHQLAEKAFEQGDRDQAIEYLGELLELSKTQLRDPGGTDLNELLYWMNQTGLLCKDNNCPEAAFAFYGLVEAVPLDGQVNPKRKRTARLGLSLTWDRVGEEKLAAEHLKSLIAEDDGSLEFGVYRAFLAHHYKDLGQLGKAVPLLEQAIKTAREEGHEEFYQQWLVLLDLTKESLTWRDRVGVRLTELLPAKVQDVAVGFPRKVFSSERLRSLARSRSKRFFAAVAVVLVLLLAVVVRSFTSSSTRRIVREGTATVSGTLRAEDIRVPLAGYYVYFVEAIQAPNGDFLTTIHHMDRPNPMPHVAIGSGGRLSTTLPAGIYHVAVMDRPNVKGVEVNSTDYSFVKTADQELVLLDLEDGDRAFIEGVANLNWIVDGGGSANSPRPTQTPASLQKNTAIVEGTLTAYETGEGVSNLYAYFFEATRDTEGRIDVYPEAQQDTSIPQTPIDSEGHFSVELPAGQYIVAVTDKPDNPTASNFSPVGTPDREIIFLDLEEGDTEIVEGFVRLESITSSVPAPTAAFSTTMPGTAIPQPAPSVMKKLTFSSAPTSEFEVVGHIGGPTLTVNVVGDYAYIGQGPKFTILDVSNRNQLREVGSVILPGRALDIDVVAHYAYVAAGYAGLRVIDVSDPTVPVEVDFYDTNSMMITSVHIAGEYAYVVGVVRGEREGGLRVFDISAPSKLREVGIYNVPEGTGDVFVAGNYAYVTGGSGGLYVLNVTNPAALREEGVYLDGDDGLAEMKRVFVAENYAYLTSASDLKVIDVSDPTMPREIGSHKVQGLPLDVYVTGNYAYVADIDVVRVLDVSDPTSPSEIGVYDAPWSVPQIRVTGEYAYLASGCEGLRVVDVSDPSVSVEVGAYGTVCFRDVYVADSYAYLDKYGGLRGEGAGLSILDISNPTVPREVGFFSEGDIEADIFVAKNYAYVAGRSPDGLRVIDTSDPTAPKVVGAYDSPGLVSRLYVTGNYAYVVSDKAGLRVVDISDPTLPTEVGAYEGTGPFRAIHTVGSYAYLGTLEGLTVVVDVSNPTKPHKVGVYKGGSDKGGSEYTAITDVFVAEGYAYAAQYVYGESMEVRQRLLVLGVSDPAAPKEEGIYELSGSIFDIYGVEKYLYIMTVQEEGYFLGVMDISDPASPRKVSSYPIPASENFFVDGEYIYLAGRDSGLLILRFSEGT